MKTVFSGLIIMVILLISPGATQCEGGPQDKEDIRKSILAGTWYPGTRQALTKAIEGYLAKADAKALKGDLRAIIVPHAGHIYSGPVAAHAYGLLRGKEIRRVIMIGPSHRVAFRGVSVNLQSGYETPLGIVRVDQELAKKIIDADPFIRHIHKVHASEHSLEIQLPFLQSILNDFQIVPIIMGEQDYGTCSRLAEILHDVVGDFDKTLLLASTDLSHYHSDKQARALDSEFIDQVQKFSPKGLFEALLSARCEACGGGPTITVMLAAQAWGANRSQILHYTHSGDVTGDGSEVVGYVAAALFEEK
ncbi:MAG: AmmeMemoRadiSam system protein B [Deltaproteobacteria bacterium]|nr:AmmeMemoRadiSam system protein B [Deltaproteobacteria bacterium]